MNERKPFILIVEDDEDVARLNARMLSRRGYDAVTAMSASEARNALGGNTPDLFVLDVMLPDGDGFSLCEELRREMDAPVIFLTGKDKPENKVEGLSKGGDYYLTKPYDMDELLAVVQSLLRRTEQTRKRIAEATVITRGTLTLLLTENKAFVNGRDAGLTHKEFAVLLILVQNEDNELMGEVIYENVWGTAMNDDSSAIRKHISRLKKKLGEEDTDDFAILSDYRGGYTFTSK